MNLWLVFLTGLTTGGLTCLAVQGGLLTGMVIGHEEKDIEEKLKHKHSAFPILIFLVAKLTSYTFLGLLLGFFGSVFQISPFVNALMQILVGIFMIITALRILDVHPIFRHFVFSTPKFLTKYIRTTSKKQGLLIPAFLGFLTIFIPCGTTQAMEILAIGSGNPFYGAAIMFTFILGTSPVFFILGYFATKLSDSLHTKFLKATALVVFILGILAFDNGLALAGSPLTLGNVFSGTLSFTPNTENASVKNEADNAIQEINIQAYNDGYYPNTIFVKKGIPVKLNFITAENYSCSRGVVIPTLGIRKILPVSGSDSINFIPEKEGTIPFSCSMGMYRGKIIVR